MGDFHDLAISQTLNPAGYLSGSHACDWTASAHIEFTEFTEFTEKLTVHTVVLRPADVFQTESQAEKYIIQRAKEWVDKRLRQI
jgi:hypothetical protein